jgi:tetratricopeptide (TPR) repeat protein
MSQIALYMGWYREHVSGPFTLPQVEFMPGAFAYHLHSFSAPSIRTATAHWVGPLLAKGATCSMGTVDEPFLTGTPDLSVFFARWSYLGFTFGEAAYAAQGILSWQTTVVGDPLYRPFGKSLQEQHNHLVTQTNNLTEWSTTRLVNMSRNQGGSVTELAIALEQTPQTKSSAVLTEKLAELYDAQGKPASTILMYERALTLNPTPQQRIRLRLELGDKLIAADRKDDARKNFEKLLEENPGYANEVIIQQKILGLLPKP